MKRSILFFIIPILTACVQLTPAGARIHVITKDQNALIADCKSLGTVSVSSEDALRNASAALAGDTAVISYTDVASTPIVHGTVYRCATTDLNTRAAIAKPEPSTQEKMDGESLRKSGICQAKGGTWTASQCVISIE